MPELVTELLAWPTGLFTVAAGLTTLYWLFVTVTGLDFFEGAEGGLDALDGVDGALDAADGALDGALDGAEGAGAASSLLYTLHLRDVPATMAVSLVALTSWLFCALTMRYLAPYALERAPSWLVGAVVAVAAIAVALPLAGAIARPFAPLFKTRAATANRSFVGATAVVRSATIAPGATGQAELETGGASVLLDVRAGGAGPLVRGDDVLIVDYDASAGVYAIEPLSRLLDAPAPSFSPSSDATEASVPDAVTQHAEVSASRRT